MSGKVILVEGFSGASKGSEGGLTEFWAEAASRSDAISKIIVLSATERKPRSSKELPIHIPVRVIHAKTLHRVFRHLPDWSLRQLGFYLGYLQWLRDSAARAEALCRDAQVDLAIHVSLSSLVAGSKIGRLRKYGVKTVLCGGWPPRTPQQFLPYLGAGERIAEHLFWMLPLLFRHRLNTDVIAASTPVSIELLKGHTCALTELVIEPTFPVPQLPKEQCCIYIDGVYTPRKGRQIILNMLKKYGESPYPLWVLSRRPDDWENFRNVRPCPFEPSEAGFERLLGSAQFVLSPSWRESSGSSLLKGASAGTIPIVSPIAGFEIIPGCAKIVFEAGCDPAEAVHRALLRVAALSSSEIESLMSAGLAWGQEICSFDRMIGHLQRWLDLPATTLAESR